MVSISLVVSLQPSKPAPRCRFSSGAFATATQPAPRIADAKHVRDMPPTRIFRKMRVRRRATRNEKTCHVSSALSPFVHGSTPLMAPSKAAPAGPGVTMRALAAALLVVGTRAAAGPHAGVPPADQSMALLAAQVADRIVTCTYAESAGVFVGEGLWCVRRRRVCRWVGSLCTAALNCCCCCCCVVPVQAVWQHDRVAEQPDARDGQQPLARAVEQHIRPDARRLRQLL